MRIEKASLFLENLRPWIGNVVHRNAAHSGSKPCRHGGTGENNVTPAFWTGMANQHRLMSGVRDHPAAPERVWNLPKSLKGRLKGNNVSVQMFSTEAFKSLELFIR